MRPAPRINAIVSLCFVLALWTSTTAMAATQPPAPTTPPASTSASYPTTTLAGQVELTRLLDLAAQRLGLCIDYDAAAIKGQVTLRLESGLSDTELWDLTNRVLAARGFTTVRQAGMAGGYSVVRIQDAAAAAPVSTPADAANHTDSQHSASPPAAGFQTLAIRAKHRSGKDLADQLAKAAGKGAGTISVLGDGGLLLVSDLSTRVEQTLRLLDLLDTPDARTVVEEVPLRNLTAPQLVTLLNQVTTKKDAVSGDKIAGEAIALPDGNAVLLVAAQSRLAEWRDLIATLDRREQVETRTYTPRHFSAKDVARLVEDTVRVRAGSGGAASSASGGDDRWRLVVDDLTGSLVITATPTQHESIQQVLDRLDQSPAGARRPVRTYTIKNRSVTEVVEVLERLLRAGALEVGGEEAAASGSGSGSAPSQTVPATGANSFPMPPPPAGSTGAAGASVAAGPESTASRSAPRDLRRTPAASVSPNSAESPVSFTIDKGTNTLIAVGEPRILDQIETVLTTLDVRQPQVMLDVLMVTLSDSDSLDLGVELEKIDINGDIRTRLSSLFGLGTRGNGGDRDGPANAAGFTGVVLSPGDFSVVLRALETLNEGRSLSMPKLLVGNNEQATLDSVVQQPFASVNASNTVSTTSFGGTQDAGTVVTVQPQIAEGDHMVLQYSVSLSSFLGAASSPTLPPARQQNRVQSIATIPDGSTVVVGGIEIDTDGETTSQIPVLGNIPIIGEAFKSRSKNKSRSRFYVFIRANILRNQNFEDLKYLSEQQVNEAGIKDQDGWPEVRPRVIR